MTVDRNALGRGWEDAARVWLEARGLKCIAQRYRCRLGEIDLVFRDGDTIVITEVRARARASLVSAAESITAAKRRRIIAATRHFLMRHAALGQRPLRFDVVAIDGIDGEAPRYEWIRSAFEAG